MAEAFGLVASIIAVVQLTDRIATVCKFCIESLEDCPQDLRGILIEISSTRALFDNLDFLRQHDPHSTSFLEKLGGANGPVMECHAAVKELENLLPWDYFCIARENRTKRQKADIMFKMLAWPLKQSRAKELLSRIVQHKTSINTAVSVEVLQTVRDIKLGVHQVQEALTDSQIHDICEWLQQNDPSPIHNTSQGLIDEGTCDWVLQLPEWTSWTNLDNQCLWIHGIPGCGKTVLAARLIQKVGQLCKERRDARWVSVYYYCHHSRNKDESNSFLRWTLSQLCRKARRISTQLLNIYRRGGEPTLVEILACLGESMEWFDSVFVTIDALDESRPTAPLLALLRTMMTDVRFRKIQLLATSRQYSEIQHAMVGICLPVPMAHPLVERDIAISVRKAIESNCRFRGWPPGLREEVTRTLSTKAEGMYRLAICQLDILRHASSIEEVAEALHRLPPSLDDTYHRIFASVAQDDRPLLKHVLQMLCFHYWLYDNCTWSRRSHRLVLDTYAARSGRRNHLYSLETLQEICGCLVAFSDCEKGGKGFLAFAHYTVREFLESPRVLAGSPAAYFALGGSNREMVEFILRHALAIPSDELVALRMQLADINDKYEGLYPLSQSSIAVYAVFSAYSILYDHEESIAADEGLSELAYRFLDPRGSNFYTRNSLMRKFLAGDIQAFRYAAGMGQRIWDIEWKSMPAPPDVGILTLLLWGSFFHLAAKLGGRIQLQAIRDSQLRLGVIVYVRHEFELERAAEFRGTITEFFVEYRSLLYSGPEAVSFLTELVSGDGSLES